jgi:hypothetical protein
MDGSIDSGTIRVLWGEGWSRKHPNVGSVNTVVVKSVLWREERLSPSGNALKTCSRIRTGDFPTYGDLQ